LPREILFATRNRHKSEEVAALLAPFGLVVKDLSAFPDMPETEETGTTFEDNARLKGETARDFTRGWALADDSGLMVDALGGEPGVASARYAGPDGTQAQIITKLLTNMKRVPDSRRQAKFVSVVALARPGEKTILFRGECPGVIIRAPRGVGGFGYDPVFLDIDLGRTFAELTLAEKNARSHRARAFAGLVKALPDLMAAAPRNGGFVS
jgi:XTP/dITP diphosphohydrolase